MIRLIKEFLRFRRVYQFLYDDADWEPADREAWSAFLKTLTGRKLVHKIRYGEAQMAIAAVEADARETLHACGRASGYRGLAALLFSLSAKEEPQSSTHAEPDEGETEFRERYSP